MIFLCMLAVLAVALGVCTALLLSGERIRRGAMEQGKFHLLTHFSNIYLLEYRFSNRRLAFSDNLPSELTIPTRLENALQCRQLWELLHPEDAPVVRAQLNAPPAPEEELIFELRLLHADACYRWYELRCVLTCDRRGRPFALLGRFENIDARKRREACLIARSTRDDLTGLLNRSAVTLQVEEYMHTPAAQSGAALFMLDLDNFKSINDTQGHSSGDRALILTAQVLQDTFRSGDVLGRAGGDEFLVFMTGVSTPEIAVERAAVLCRTLEESSGGSFTCSIGIALCPQDGSNYAALFETADAAMYQAKRDGKNSYRLASAPGDLVRGA